MLAQVPDSSKNDLEYFCDILLKVKIEDANIEIEKNAKIKKIYLKEKSSESQIVFIPEFRNQKISKVKAQINGEKIKKGNLGYDYIPVPDEFYHQMKLFYIAPTFDLKPGDIFIHKFRINYDNIMFIPIEEIPNEGYIKEYRYSIKHPKEMNVHFTFFFPRDSIPYIIDKQRDDITSLYIENVKPDSFLPLHEFNNILASFMVTLTKNNEAALPITPDRFVSWYYNYGELGRRLDSLTIPDIKSLFDSTQSDTALLREIHDYVRHNIRYVSEYEKKHDIVAYHPNRVFRNKYGDCKDRAMLVTAIADMYGLDVKMGLVHYDLNYDFGSLVHPALFNHVICYYKNENREYYFDPTARFSMFYNPLNYLSGRDILILDKSNPRWDQIHPASEKPTLELIIDVDPESLQSAIARLYIRNELQYEFLSAEMHLSDIEYYQYIEDRLEKSFIKIEFDNIKEINQFDDHIEFSADADLSGFAIQSSDKIYFPQLAFALGDKIIAKHRGNSAPMHMGKPLILNLELYLNDSTYSCIPDSGNLFLDDSTYYKTSISTGDSGNMIISYYYKRYSEIIQGERKEPFIDFCLDLMTFRKEMFTITKREEL